MACSPTTTARKKARTPVNPLVGPLLTDFYQISMAYTLYFRKNPFGGEFTIFGGLEECLCYVENFKVTDDDVEYLRTLLPPDEFFEWIRRRLLQGPDLRRARGHGRLPKRAAASRGAAAGCARPEPTLVAQVTTNAARMRLAAGPDKKLLEFGLRRAQGPDGGVSASRYAFQGGFDGTSNVLAGRLFPDLPVSGTHSHAFVQSYITGDELDADGVLGGVNLAEAALTWRRRLGYEDAGRGSASFSLPPRRTPTRFRSLHAGEFAAFVAYALANPTNFVALVDTYSTLETGLKNFVTVALALKECGFAPKGVRIDSGDLAYLSRESRALFAGVVDAFRGTRHEATAACLEAVSIVASNDINETVLLSLKEQGHAIDCYGIGTHLVGERILCRHPFDHQKRAYVTPSKVLDLHQLVFDGTRCDPDRSLVDIRDHCLEQLRTVREDILRPLNPTPYKTSVTPALFTFFQEIWQRNEPVRELS
ncbi:nicotinate phosphoribosyltransferase [Aureococcus anophagefferens]|nr:nicotinate phosphoribosyltransferase [Aureococcus anophagefferens]